MDLKTFQSMMLPVIDSDLRGKVGSTRLSIFSGLSDLLSYQLGWTGEGAGVEAQGKRLRPLLVTLTAAAVGGDWQKALPAASAVELIHNFSLIHDDIEDGSLKRRGRATVWSKWGMEPAINAGDAMFALAYDSLVRLAESGNPETVVPAVKILTDACIQLTGGQHLDISYEDARSLPLDSYWPMVTGKTASLLAASVQLGAICGGAGPETQNNLRRFGYSLGLGFQVKDDWLGIWGDETTTGKSTATDLISRKKTLPVLYGLERDDQFAHLWADQSNDPDNLKEMVNRLTINGARDYTDEQVRNYTIDARTALEAANLSNDAGIALRDLAVSLINRQF